MFLGVLLCACTSIPSPSVRLHSANQLAISSEWQGVAVPTSKFTLRAYLPKKIKPAEHLTVYIEGDGFAWRTRRSVSRDPTPRNPLVLKLAMSHANGNAAYVARPCQYVGAQRQACDSQYWTGARFSEDVVLSMNQAVGQLKQRFGAASLTLIGYSGGGAIAALLAARRDDVARLITVVGNLDHRAWTAHHHISPLTQSLNPVNEVDKLKHIEQWHFVGEEDKNITPALLRDFVQRFPKKNKPRLMIMRGYDHHNYWARDWHKISATFVNK